jgi:uncharacterized membrane protein
MKKFYIITIVVFLLLALFYSYGISVDRDHGVGNPAVAADADMAVN